MAIKLIDGYDYIPDGTFSAIAAAQGYSGTVGAMHIDGSTAFGSGKRMWIGDTGSNNTDFYRSARGRWTGTMVWGMRMMVPVGVNSLGTVADHYKIGAIDTMAGFTAQWTIRFTMFGNIQFYAGSSGTMSAKTPAMTFVPGTWFYLEVKWKPGYGSAGTFEIRINTVPVLSLPAITTAAGTLVLPATSPGFDTLWFSKSNFNGDQSGWSFDDMYLLDDSGSSNTDYLGNVRAQYLPPVSNDTVTWNIGGTAPAATNWQSVLNTSINDAQYVASGVVGNRDLYNINPAVNSPVIFGVEVGGAYRQDDATQRWVRNTIKSGGVDNFGTAHAINQSYTFYQDIYELNPATGVAFTGAEVNALKVGPKVDT